MVVNYSVFFTKYANLLNIQSDKRVYLVIFLENKNDELLNFRSLKFNLKKKTFARI